MWAGRGAAMEEVRVEELERVDVAGVDVGGLSGPADAAEGKAGCGCWSLPPLLLPLPLLAAPAPA